MSVPPASPPPGGYYPAPPPPRQSNGPSGCWKVGGITCGVLLLLGIVGVIIGGIQINKAAHQKGSIFSLMVSIPQTIVAGQSIQKAIVRYHGEHGHYPNSLVDLVPGDLPDGKILHSDLDPVASPGHVSWSYTRPGEGAPGSTVILDCPYTLPGNEGRPGPVAHITILLDGTTPKATGMPSAPPSSSGG